MSKPKSIKKKREAIEQVFKWVNEGKISPFEAYLLLETLESNV